MSWTLKYGNEEKSFADWGLSNLSRRLINQGCDRITLDQNIVSLEKDLLFSAESVVSIGYNGVTWFQGVVTRVPSIGFPSAEKKSYQIDGPWWYLQNTVFQQEWVNKSSLNSSHLGHSFVLSESKDLVVPSLMASSYGQKTPSLAQTLHEIFSGKASEKDLGKRVISSRYKSRVILGQKTAGSLSHYEHISNGDQIREILEYAMRLGIPIQIGQIEPDTYFPFDETKDISCAEAIQRVLRWSPDCIVWFDYSTSPYPTMHVQRRKNLAPLQMDLNRSSIKNIAITPRYDLKVPSVMICYEKKHNCDGDISMTTHEDVYPEGAQSTDLKSMILSIELQGSQSTEVEQKLVTEPIRPDDPGWWMKRIPALSQSNIAHFEIHSFSQSTTLPNEIISGSVSDWMNVKVETGIFRAKISYETDFEIIVEQEISVILNATDANSFCYRHEIDFVEEEAVPQGLAQKLYESVGELQFDGAIEFLDKEIAFESLMGRSICISGGRLEWENMRGLIQEIRQEVDIGMTWVRFGPPSHLGADDLVELLRVNRRRNASVHANKRHSAEKSSIKLSQPTHYPYNTIIQSSPKYGKLVIRASSNPEKRVILDAEKLHEGEVLELKEEYICHMGNLRKRMVLSTDPYNA